MMTTDSNTRVKSFRRSKTNGYLKPIIGQPKRHTISDTTFHLLESVHLKMPSTGVQTYLVNTLISSPSGTARKLPCLHGFLPEPSHLQHQSGELWKSSFIVDIYVTCLRPSHPILKPSQLPSVPCGDNFDQNL